MKVGLLIGTDRNTRPVGLNVVADPLNRTHRACQRRRFIPRALGNAQSPGARTPHRSAENAIQTNRPAAIRTGREIGILVFRRCS